MESISKVLILFATILGASYGVQDAAVSLLSPQGLRISIPDVAGASLAAVHYSINSPLSGVQAGTYNYDIGSKTGDQWVHENRSFRLNEGDIVYYWLYMVVNGVGQQITDHSWIVQEEPSTDSTTSAPSSTDPLPTDPTTPSAGLQLSSLSPQGLRFSIPDVADASLAAVHYSVNSPLTGIQAGRYNYDIRSKTDGRWVHENRSFRLNEGDIVYYWLYMVVNGVGRQTTDQRWVVSGVTSPTTPPTTHPTAPPTTTSSGGGSWENSTWNGRNLRLVFEDNFSESAVDTAKWEHEVSLWGGGNWEFQAYTNLAQNSFTKNGALYLKPTATADKYGEAWLTTGRWDMREMYGTCTMEAVWGCLREGQNGILNPIMSSKLRSRKGIKYGKVEIVAKMPRGDWLWPALWMLPNHGSRNGGGPYGGWPRSGEIDIMESRGNRQYGNLGVEHMGSTLHWGTEHVNKYALTSAHKKISNGNLADGYHRYTFYWDQNGMDFYLDDDKVARFATPSQGFFRWGNLPGANIWSHANNAPFDTEFYLVMNVAVGGTNGFFPDGVTNAGYSKPWSNQDRNAPEKFWKAKDMWQPTWQGDDAAMIVDSVKMWQLE